MVNLANLIALDEQDVLARFREEFYTQEGVIYLNGNSLGLMSKRAEQTTLELLESWKTHGITGWTEGEHPWFYFTHKLSKMMAPIVGANEENVCITGSTTSNIHQLIRSLYQPTDTKYKIVGDTLNFPTDIYAIQSIIRTKGLEESAFVQISSANNQTLSEDDIINAMTNDVALILLPSVLYRSGQILNMKRLTQAAHDKGIIIGFDLCHSVGAVPHELDTWDVDFAVWCTYKHLNGGPGSVAGLYLNPRHHHIDPALAGWFGSDPDKQFDMEHTFTKASDAKAFQMGTPHVLSMAPLLGALEIMNEATIETVRQKSLRMTDILIQLIEEKLTKYGFTVETPLSHDVRGGHVYIEHVDAARISRAMKDEHIIPDFRAPRGIRLSPVALYNTYEELYELVERMIRIMEDETYKKYKNERGVVA